MIRRNKILLGVVAAALLAGAMAGCQSVDSTLFETGRKALRAVSGLKPGTLQVGEHTIAYFERPGDGPVLVLLHGFASEKDVWLRFLGGLPRDYRIIALDLPGHGDSERVEHYRYDTDGIVTLVEQAIGELAPGTVHVAGTSLGGMIATLYTSRVPHKVETLALFAPAGVYPESPSDFQVALARGENPLIASNAEEFDTLIDIVFFDPPILVWPVGSALTDIAIDRAPFHTKIWNDLWPDHKTLDDVLPHIDQPVLLVWGNDDRVLDVSSADVFTRLLDDVQLHRIDELGHALVNEKPRALAQLYRDFLESDQ